MNNDLKISMKLKSSDNINMKLEDSKVINANMNGGIVETDPIFVNSPAYEITYNDINYWNNKSNFSGNYNDLRNKPIIPTRTDQLTNDSGYITKDVSNLTNYTLSTNLSLVATTGLYNDLLEKPTIPTDTSDLTNNAGYITNTVNDLIYYTPTSDLSLVATTGSYTDLSNTPTLANVATTGLYDDLLNKPTLSTVASTGDYDDLLNKPTIPTKTSDLQNDSGFITNANIPTKTSDLTNDSGFIDKNVNDLTYYTLSSNLASVATSGSYNDLSNTPTIPTVPTNVSSFTNDAGYITNTVNDLTNYTLSSNLSSVATSGSYNDLSNTPTIPTASTLNVYSSTEEVVGTWLGKPLYRKVIDSGALPNASVKQVDANISNFKLFTKLEGIAYNSSGNIAPFPNANLGSNSGIITIATVNDAIYIKTNVNLSSYTDSYLIIEYTKTTD